MDTAINSVNAKNNPNPPDALKASSIFSSSALSQVGHVNLKASRFAEFKETVLGTAGVVVVDIFEPVVVGGTVLDIFEPVVVGGTAVVGGSVFEGGTVVTLFTLHEPISEIHHFISSRHSVLVSLMLLEFRRWSSSS